jgi:hypothetical protein
MSVDNDRRWLTLGLHAATRAAHVAFDMLERNDRDVVQHDVQTLQALLDQARIIEKHTRELLLVLTTRQQQPKKADIYNGMEDVRSLSITLPVMIQLITFLNGGPVRLSPADVFFIERDVNHAAAYVERKTPGSFFERIVSLRDDIQHKRTLLGIYNCTDRVLIDYVRPYLLQAEHLIDNLLVALERNSISTERARERQANAGLLVEFMRSFSVQQDDSVGQRGRVGPMDLTQFQIGTCVNIPPMGRCSQCKTTYYISREDQVNDWPLHRLSCVARE